MKKFIILTLALIMTLSLAACGKPTGLQNSDAPKIESPVKSPETEAPKSESSTENPEPEDNKSFIGLWHSMNMVAAGFGERYAFNEDGTFIFGSSQMDEFERQLYTAGRWSVTEGKLKLEVNVRLVVPVGETEDIVPSDELIILDRGVVKVIHDPPEIESYSIAKTGTDPKTGRNTITIDGITFYDFNNQTDMFDEYYDLNDSGGSASPEEWSDPGDTDKLQWWGTYKSEDLGFSIEITEYSGVDFLVKIYLLRDSHTVLEGKAVISAEYDHLAVFKDFGFYLYEDFSAIDIVASEDSEWSHMRGQYKRVE